MQLCFISIYFFMNWLFWWFRYRFLSTRFDVAFNKLALVNLIIKERLNPRCIRKIWFIWLLTPTFFIDLEINLWVLSLLSCWIIFIRILFFWGLLCLIGFIILLSKIFFIIWGIIRIFQFWRKKINFLFISTFWINAWWSLLTYQLMVTIDFSNWNILSFHQVLELLSSQTVLTWPIHCIRNNLFLQSYFLCPFI